MSAALELRARRKLSRADYDKFLPLVRRTAIRVGRKVPTQISVADLVGYGWIGLLEAFERSSAEMTEEEFEAYALYRVRGAMLDYLRSLDPMTRTARKLSREVAQAIANLSTELGRPPEEDEIAGRLAMSVDAYRTALDRLGQAGMARLEMLDVDELKLDAAEELPDEELTRTQIGHAVAAAIEHLPLKLQQVLGLHYTEGRTLREVGIVFDVSESRACQLHTEAIHRLRAAIGRI